MVSKPKKLSDTPILTKSRKGQLLERMREEGVEFAVNTELRPVAIMPQNELQPIVLVDSQDFKDNLIIGWAEMFNNYNLQGADLNLMLCLIRAECRQGARIVTEIEADNLEDNPIFQAIIEYMNDVSMFDGPTRKLHEEYCSVDKCKNSCNISRITPYLNSFARDIRRLRPALQGYGVDVEVFRKEAGSHTILKRNESFAANPVPIIRGGRAAYIDNPQAIIVPSAASPEASVGSDSNDGTEGSPEGTEDAAGGTEGPPVGSDGNDVGSTEENS